MSGQMPWDQPPSSSRMFLQWAQMGSMPWSLRVCSSDALSSVYSRSLSASAVFLRVMSWIRMNPLP
jgi:hypothetical protein